MTPLEPSRPAQRRPAALQALSTTRQRSASALIQRTGLLAATSWPICLERVGRTAESRVPRWLIPTGKLLPTISSYTQQIQPIGRHGTRLQRTIKRPLDGVTRGPPMPPALTVMSALPWVGIPAPIPLKILCLVRYSKSIRAKISQAIRAINSDSAKGKRALNAPQLDVVVCSPGRPVKNLSATPKALHRTSLIR